MPRRASSDPSGRYGRRREEAVEQMSRARTERLLNLVICLLATRRRLSREEIRRLVPGYAQSDEAFERAFERDKEALREMGIPVEVGPKDVLFDDEVGYRIRREAYALPEVAFTRDEMAVLTLAARAWQQAALAGPAARALLKLQATGVATADLTIEGIDPRLDTSEAAFLPLVQAARDRRRVTFPYRKSGAGAVEQRTVEPWGLVAWHGRWYLVGHDRGRAATRVFRLSRVAGPVAAVGSPGEVTVPAAVDLRAVVASTGSAEPRGTACVRVRPGAGLHLRRRAALRATAEGWDELELAYVDVEALADDVVGLGANAVVVDPPELRHAVVRRLRAVLDGLPVPAGEATP